MNEVKALHIASFHGNIGDNANHNGFRRKLKKSLEVNIKFDEIEMREFYQSWNLRDFNSDDFIDLCNNYDLIIIGGGNFFELKWDYSYTGTTVNISHDTLRKINTPIFFHGVGCDIAKGTSSSAITKFDNFLEVLTNSNKYLVSVRNDGSNNTIKKLYGSKYNGKVHKVADGAFFLETTQHEFPELNHNLKSIGINVVSDMKDIRFDTTKKNGIEYDEFIEGFAKYLNQFLLENQEYQLIFFPHIYSDLLSIYDLISRIDDKFRRTRVIVAPCITGEGSEDYIFSLYKECDLVLGMRFHSNVCSIAQNIPTIALSSYKKIYDLYSELHLLERVIEVNKEGFLDKLIVQVDYTLNNLEDIKKHYQIVNMNIEKESVKFYSKIKAWALENSII